MDYDFVALSVSSSLDEVSSIDCFIEAPMIFAAAETGFADR
jgi:hypothetical protein